MDKRRTLLEEKRKLLVLRLSAAESQVQAGVASQSDLIDPQIAVAAVDVELARNQNERLATLRRIVDLRRRLEERAESDHRAGINNLEARTNAQIARIDAELALEEATRRKP